MIYLYSIFRALCLKLRLGKSFNDISHRSVFRHGSVIRVMNNGRLTIGKMKLEERSSIIIDGGNLVIGKNNYINMNTIISCREEIIIGDDVIIGPNVSMFDHDHLYDIAGYKTGYKTEPIKIGKHCWIGAGVIILRGTDIGDYCVIGAGSIVNGKIPSHSLMFSAREKTIRELK